MIDNLQLCVFNECLKRRFGRVLSVTLTYSLPSWLWRCV